VYTAERKVAMNRKLAPLVAGLLLLALGVTARADVTYQITSAGTTDSGPISGFIGFPASDVNAGLIPTGIYTNYSIAMPSAVFPFVPHTFTSADAPIFGASVITPITVDPGTKQFTAPFTGTFGVNFLQAGILEGIVFDITGPDSADITVFRGTASEAGVARLAVPEPSSMLLLVSGGISGLVYCGTRLRSRQRKGNL
jgi:hypothetical protein